MANMSYCRWENTSRDMHECVDALAEVQDVAEWFASLNEYEQRGVRLALRMARTLVEELEPELPQE